MPSDSNDPNKYNFPFRTNFEFKIMAVWLVAAVCCLLATLLFDVPVKPYAIAALGCAVTGLLIGRNGMVIHIRKQRLKGYPLEFISADSDSSLKLFGITDKEVLKNVRQNRK